MAPPEVWAYPLLLAATYGVYRVGRASVRPWRVGLEWARTVVLAVLLGLVVAVQVRMVSLGLVRSPASLWAVSLSIAAVGCLVGLNVYLHLDAWRNGREIAEARASSTSG